jgi:hypothetical protein
MRNVNTSNTYLAALLVSTVITAVLVISVNLLFDPLWYFKGNSVGQYNVRFNERLTKTNQFLKQIDSYDCVIFGSSRVTTLNEHKIDTNACFNYSISGGYVTDHLAFARYAKHWLGDAQLIVVGVDGFNFRGIPEVEIPDFIEAFEPPQHWLLCYLSLDSLKFSVRVWREKDFFNVKYNRDFVGVETKRYSQPESKKKWREVQALLDGKSFDDKTPKKIYSPKNKVIYQNLSEVFGQSRLVGYVPPISADNIVLMHLKGELVGYLRALHSTAEVFDSFYDFTSPSTITLNPDNTWDGSHYYPEINDKVAARLAGKVKTDEFGLDIKALSFAQYLDLSVVKVERILAQRFPDKYQAAVR